MLVLLRLYNVEYWRSNIILATSTAIECVFSTGRQLLQFTCNRLSGQSIRALMCFGDWSRKDLVLLPDVVEAIRFKRGPQKRYLSDLGSEEI